ncbi:MAG: hypothetical protein IKW46_08200 [Bacteroidaceae bacterium]|nr:hypothetical protein [Bacteroidaceae bacterium]
MNEKAKDVVKKAAQRFLQSSIAYLVAAFSTQIAGVDVFDLHALKSVAGSLIIGAFAAGLSASWNGVIQPVLDKMKGGV